jgi:hypothetical protein
MFLLHETSAQSLLEIYKKGTVKLVPDAGYAQGNQWDKVFETYYDTLYNRPMGNRKSIILMPDGSVVVNHAYHNYYSLFDANGKFVKEFGITGSSGKQLQKVNGIAGIINNNFFTGLDNTGKMICFDFNGKYVKTLTLDYMTKQMIPLSNNKIAVVGWVIWKDRIRDFVAIVDYQTNAQKVIWEKFTNRSDFVTIVNAQEVNRDDGAGDSKRQLFSYTYKFDKGYAIQHTMPYENVAGLNAPPKIAFVNNDLIVALPHTGEILTYDVNGNLKSKNQIEWGRKNLSVEEQKEIQKKAIEMFSEQKDKLIASGGSQEENERILAEMKEDLEKITDPIPIPVFSNMIKDSDGNLLFFEMPESEGANRFNVWIYQDGGKFVCQSSFECDDYNLSITPSKMVFHNGYIYALQTLKESGGNPLRLVRFKVTN